MSVLVISFVTLDGVVTDPDGSAGSPRGGWMFRYGRTAIDGDKFGIGPILRDGAVLLGRGTWQAFARLWPTREGEFADRMNGTEKLVATRNPDIDLSAWSNSRVLSGDLVEALRNEKRDVVVLGSLSIARELAAADLVDEYRLVTVPTVLGAGERLFAAEAERAEFECVECEPAGPLAYTRYRRVRG